jgi:glycolate oxidase FAD binding subunit
MPSGAPELISRLKEICGREHVLTALTQIIEHNAGDLTATLEAGVPLAHAQQTFARAGQMLALDPPTGADGSATIGGIVATGDSGPLRHRYGAPRDLVVGMTFALGDGTIARSGGKVIKNVAGYDLAKLFAGSFGTLGMILSVSVRLHPLPATTQGAL